MIYLLFNCLHTSELSHFIIIIATGYTPSKNEADFDRQPMVKYEGTYTTPLTARALRRLLLKPKEHPARIYVIQGLVSSKYGDHNTVIRLSYNSTGKCSAWAMTRNTPFIQKSSPTKKSICNNSVMGRQKTADLSRSFLSKPSSNNDHSVKLSPSDRQPTVQFSFDHEPNERVDPHWSSFRRSSINCSESFLRTESNDPFRVPEYPRDGSEQNIEDITNLHDVHDDYDELIDAEPKRFLDNISSENCTVHEVVPLAAEPIVEHATALAKHFSSVFHRKLEDLTIDVAKDMSGRYFLVDIVAYRFEGSAQFPVKLTSRVRNQIEMDCQCILDPYRSHLEYTQMNECDVSLPENIAQKESASSKVDWSSKAIGASPCSMCESKLPPGQLCYSITSTMIQSTIVHMRSRLPLNYWPNFCRDSCYAVRSLIRIEDDPFNVKGLTVADIRICSLCHEICNKEMALIEVEQKLAKFTRSTKDVPVTTGTISASPAVTLTDNKATEHEFVNRSPNKVRAEEWNPTESFRIRNRPSIFASGLKLPTGSQNSDSNGLSSSQKLGKSSHRASEVDLRATSGFQSSKGSPIRSSPNRCVLSPGFTNTKASIASSLEKKSARNVRQSTSKEIKIPATGRSVNRSSLNEDMTMCRMFMGIQQIKDIPTIIFEHFKNFRVCYHCLGRDISFPAIKKSKYYRKNAYKYKTFSVDGENDSVSLSSGSEDDGSDFDPDDNHRNISTKKYGGSGVLSTVTEENLSMDEPDGSSTSSSEEDVSIVVGTLVVQRMRVTHALIPGNSACGTNSEGLEKYFAKNRHILVTLCGDIKEGADIYDENRWLCPPEGYSSASKVKDLQHKLTNIRLDAVNKTLFGDKYCGSNSLRQRHLARIFRKSTKKIKFSGDSPRRTERGETLPEGAIAYGYVNYYQFLNATVNRIGVVTPMTYALSHVPIERSVPMLQVVVNFLLLKSFYLSYVPF